MRTRGPSHLARESKARRRKSDEEEQNEATAEA
jgi:hypothetical protein